MKYLDMKHLKNGLLLSLLICAMLSAGCEKFQSATETSASSVVDSSTGIPDLSKIDFGVQIGDNSFSLDSVIGQGFTTPTSNIPSGSMQIRASLKASPATTFPNISDSPIAIYLYNGNVFLSKYSTISSTPSGNKRIYTATDSSMDSTKLTASSLICVLNFQSGTRNYFIQDNSVQITRIE